MRSKPIVAGVDMSPQAAAAAAFAWQVAQRAKTDCYFVHGARPLFQTPAAAEFLTNVELLVEQQLEASRIGVVSTLQRALPAQALAAVEIRLGRGAAVVAEVAHERGAGLIVVGGKHHSVFARWMGGSTAHHLVRTTDTPVLVTGEHVGAINQILVAADLSYAAQPTLEAAVRIARLFGARLRVLHAVEPLPIIPEVPLVLDEQAFFDDSKAQFERCLEPLVESVTLETTVRRGRAADVIADEARAWKADLTVMGSHGKGWVDRLLVGSTTERLLDQLPTSLLVIPVPPAAGEGRRGRGERKTARRHQLPTTTVRGMTSNDGALR